MVWPRNVNEQGQGQQVWFDCADTGCAWGVSISQNQCSHLCRVIIAGKNILQLSPVHLNSLLSKKCKITSGWRSFEETMYKICSLRTHRLSELKCLQSQVLPECLKMFWQQENKSFGMNWWCCFVFSIPLLIYFFSVSCSIASWTEAKYLCLN